MNTWFDFHKKLFYEKQFYFNLYRKCINADDATPFSYKKKAFEKY